MGSQGSLSRDSEGMRTGEESLAARWRLALSAKYFLEDADDSKDAPRITTLEAVRKRLCSHEGTFEIFAFLGWLLIITAHVAQLWALWWFFWQHVIGDVNARQRRSESTVLHYGAAAAQVAGKGGSSHADSLARRAVRRSITVSRAKAAACLATWLSWLTVAVAARRIFKRLMPAMVRAAYYIYVYKNIKI